MKALEKIKEYYRPIQPTVDAKNEEIRYHEIKPTRKVSNLIYCYWQLKTQTELRGHFNYRVVSDGCVDIFFNSQNPKENFIMGFCRKYTEFPIGKQFNYIGIRFLPVCFPLLFGMDARGVSNKSQNLDEVLPNFSYWIAASIQPNQSFENTVALLNGKFKGLLQEKEFDIDSRFFKALTRIFENRGSLDTEKDLDTGLSPRQLRRIFNFYIGTTPKAFSNVVRFQHILNAKPSTRSLKENKLYFDVGFYDQAHFIKNFKTFYGVTPSEAFR